jgi:hypothetical protein
MKLLHLMTDEEVIANGCKCIRISLRDERHLQSISVHTDGGLVNELIDLIGKHQSSEYVITEASAAIKNYLRQLVYTNHIKQKNISTLINAAMSTKFPRARNNIIMILKACTDVPDFKKYIAELGGNAILNETGSE